MHLIQTEKKQLRISRENKGKEAVEDLLNNTILHVDISTEGLVIIHNPPSFDQKPVALKGRKMRD